MTDFDWLLDEEPDIQTEHLYGVVLPNEDNGKMWAGEVYRKCQRLVMVRRFESDCQEEVVAQMENFMSTQEIVRQIRRST